MAILNDAVTATKEHGKLKWNEAERTAVSELASRMQNLPRVSYDPLQLFASDKYIIVILGDASKTGAGSSIYLVHLVKAKDFTKEQLLSKETLLVDCYHKVLSERTKEVANVRDRSMDHGEVRNTLGRQGGLYPTLATGHEASSWRIQLTESHALACR